MRFILVTLSFFLAVPAYASSLTFELRFVKDYALELQTGFDPDLACAYDAACYPDGFRLPDGIFSGLEPGDAVTAKVDVAGNSAQIGDWSVLGDLIPSTNTLARFVSNVPIGLTTFTSDFVTVMDEGPRGANLSGSCNPSEQGIGLPLGFCGFSGYQAEFEVVSISTMPLPASSGFLLGGLGLLWLARRRWS